MENLLAGYSELIYAEKPIYENICFKGNGIKTQQLVFKNLKELLNVLRMLGFSRSS